MTSFEQLYIGSNKLNSLLVLYCRIAAAPLNNSFFLCHVYRYVGFVHRGKHDCDIHVKIPVQFFGMLLVQLLCHHCQ